MISQFRKIPLFTLLTFVSIILLIIYNTNLFINFNNFLSYKKKQIIAFNFDNESDISKLFVNHQKNDNVSKITTSDKTKDLKLNKFVILSVSLVPNKDFYYFQLPMIVKAWARVGFKTVVIVVASKFPTDNKLGAKTVEYLEKFNSKVINLETSSQYEVIISLVSRLFSSLIDNSIIKDEDFIITSDSDLYPLDSTYYLNDQRLSKNESIFLWNAFCCGDFNFRNRSYTMYPIGHIGMKKKYWRSIMNLDKEKDPLLNSTFMLKYLKEFFKGDRQVKQNDEIGRGDDNWYMDQVMIGVNIGNYKLDINKNVDLIKLPHSCARLDRSFFNPGNYDMKKFCDFHSFHEDAFKKFDALTKIYKNIFDEKTNFLIQQYYKEFMEIKNTKN